MATSGSELTRVGYGTAVGISLTITAKAASTAATIIKQARGISRFVFARVFGRIN